MIPLILADDFSGACDAAASAAAAGYSAAALLTPPLEAQPASLLAYSTETRHLSGNDARAVIRALAPACAGRTLYKKIDSTLRGPWVQEVDEILAVSDFSQAVVCPAFPALGRTVRNGWLYVDDRPFQQIVCPFEVRDAVTEQDLARLAAEICTSILPVGSAGLARHFFALHTRNPAADSPLSQRGSNQNFAPSRPFLALVGSENPVSLSQLRFLREGRPDDVIVNPDSYPEALAGVFATGGETAARFLRASGARGITGLRDLLPGVPAGHILGGRYNDVYMITKAGGFGAPDAILTAIQIAKRG
jgi:uncharacterized protein YgbK (DUF1537 family)